MSKTVILKNQMEICMEQTLPKLFRQVAEQYPDIPYQLSRGANGDFESVSYQHAYSLSLSFGAGLLSAGVVRGEHIGLISDNRKEWEQADMGLLAVGAVDVPRGCDATIQDLAYILSFAGCRMVITENGFQLRKILGLHDQLPLLKTIIVFDQPDESDFECAGQAGVSVVLFSDVIASGDLYRKDHPGAIEAELAKGQFDDVAAIIFTSGTTGTPKGVMLSHGNFLTQLDELKERIWLNPGDRALLVLPIWHAFQRLCEYVILVQAATLCYSKPVGSILLSDLEKLNPQLLPAVPRVFEAIYDGINRAMRKTGGMIYVLYRFFVSIAIIHARLNRILFKQNACFKKSSLNVSRVVLVFPWILLYPLKLLGSVLVLGKIRAKLGSAFRAGVSGGGALPPAIDEFFWAVGVNVVEGYGLTETAPVVSVRPISAPVFGTVGTPIRGVQVRVVDENGNDLGKGKKGVLQVKGGTVMKGYYHRDDLTSRVLSSDGWFDTGDIAVLTIHNEIVLRGRMKDTIVLRGGENVEPLPIEMKLSESRFVKTAVVVGQDQRYLAALVVPDEDEVKEYAKENSISFTSYDVLLDNEEILKLFETEITSLVNARNGFKLFERINKFQLLSHEFETGAELSAKQEIMRYRINEIYAKEIKNLFK
jgi:long-chain acyl-CoA synthetase